MRGEDLQHTACPCAQIYHRAQLSLWKAVQHGGLDISLRQIFVTQLFLIIRDRGKKRIDLAGAFGANLS